MNPDNLTPHAARVLDFMQKIGRPIPTKPEIPSGENRILRARLIMEEVLELIDGLGVGLFETGESRQTTGNAINFKHLDFACTHEPNLVKIADGCGDGSVVIIGTFLACGIEDKPVLELIDANNLAKFSPGHSLNEFGKLVKPPGHKPPDIARELEHQRMIEVALENTADFMPKRGSLGQAEAEGFPTHAQTLARGTDEEFDADVAAEEKTLRFAAATVGVPVDERQLPEAAFWRVQRRWEDAGKALPPAGKYVSLAEREKAIAGHMFAKPVSSIKTDHEPESPEDRELSNYNNRTRQGWNEHPPALWQAEGLNVHYQEQLSRLRPAVGDSEAVWTTNEAAMPKVANLLRRLLAEAGEGDALVDPTEVGGATITVTAPHGHVIIAMTQLGDVASVLFHPTDGNFPVNTVNGVTYSSPIAFVGAAKATPVPAHKVSLDRGPARQG